MGRCISVYINLSNIIKLQLGFTHIPINHFEKLI